MKILNLIFYSLFFNTFLLAQNKEKILPLILKGRITNCIEKILKINFTDKNGIVLTDTLRLTKIGDFYLKTFKIKEPQITSIQQNNIQINDFFVAPGYNLRINANAKDWITLQKTKKIEGIGSESNRYRIILDSILIEKNDSRIWFNLNQNDLVKYINYYKDLKDSIASTIFFKKAIKDKYLYYFGTLVKMDNTFEKLGSLVEYINIHKYSYDSSMTFLNQNFDNNILTNLYKDEYLASKAYKNSLISYRWINFLVRTDNKKDSTILNENIFKLKKVNEIYSGKIKEFVLFKKIKSMIESSSSVIELIETKIQFEKYKSALNFDTKKHLTESLIEKEKKLFKIQTGQAAPSFTLKDNFGKMYKLKDFIGKVIYIDLWASWCKPCRAEVPFLKKINEKYKNEKRIVFVSIAVNDGYLQWLKALKVDKPTWIQLIDKNDSVSNSYNSNAIPQFILINKKGNIVDIDAPRPSSNKKLLNLLEDELAK